MPNQVGHDVRKVVFYSYPFKHYKPIDLLPVYFPKSRNLFFGFEKLRISLTALNFLYSLLYSPPGLKMIK